MLVPLDDYFIHQNAESIATVGHGAKTWQERNYFNVHSTDGEVLLTCGMGTTPNRDLANAYVISSIPGVGQTNYRAVRPIAGERTRMDVGAFAYEIVEPFKQWRITLGPNDSGLELDLEWTARHQPWEFGKIHAENADGRILHDFVHIHQSGTYRGSMTIDGRTYDVDGWYGERDRTWGIRDSLEFWIWSAVQFEDSSLSLYHFEDRHGNVQYSNGGVCREDSVGPKLRLVEHKMNFEPGARIPLDGELRFAAEDGSTSTVEFRNLGPVASYISPLPHDPRNPRHSTLNRDDNGYEVWPYPRYWDAFTDSPVFDALCEFRLDGKVGYGVLELVAISYEPYGFRSPFRPSAS